MILAFWFDLATWCFSCLLEYPFLSPLFPRKGRRGEERRERREIRPSSSLLGLTHDAELEERPLCLSGYLSLLSERWREGERACGFPPHPIQRRGGRDGTGWFVALF